LFYVITVVVVVMFVDVAKFRINVFVLTIGRQEFENGKDRIVPPTHPVYQRVVGVVRKIVDSNQDLEFMRQQTWTIVVVDSEEINAFVLPVRNRISLCYF